MDNQDEIRNGDGSNGERQAFWIKGKDRDGNIIDTKYFTPSIEDMMKNPEKLPFANMKRIESPMISMEEDEIWKPVIGYEGLYEVSNKGRVKRVEYLLTESNTAWGYKKVSLTKNKKNSNLSIHRLVAQAFHENPENKPTVNHKDGNKHNNSASNLEWNTVQENVDHAIENNLRPADYQDGEKNPMAKLTKAKVAKIKEMLKGMSIREVAQMYPEVCYSTIYGIKTGRLWKR